VSIAFQGYAYPDGEGPDADWVRGVISVEADGVQVEGRFLTLASEISTWVNELTEITRVPRSDVVLSNTEDDFNLKFHEVGGDLQGTIAMKLGCGLRGSFNLVFPLTLDAVDVFRVALEEATWVYPERG